MIHKVCIFRYRTDTYSVPLSSTHRRLPSRPGDFAPPDASASASACATLDSRRPLRVRFADQVSYSFFPFTNLISSTFLLLSSSRHSLELFHNPFIRNAQISCAILCAE